MPTSIVEVNFNNDGSTWTDITAYVLQWSTNRGSSRAEGPIVRYQAGRATVVLRNDDYRFDPTNLSGPYVSGGATQVLPMRQMRIRATWNAVTYNIFRGYIDNWPVDYVNAASSRVQITVTDATKVIAAFDANEVSPVGAGEDTGARINRVLDNAGWPAGLRNIDTGDTTVQATNLSQNAWTEILLTADTENGAVFIDDDGKVRFIKRSAQINGTSVATFGDAAGELPYDAVTVEYDDEQIWNLYRVSRVGGAQQVQENTTSEAAYNEKRTLTRTDLIMQDDDTANNWAGWGLYQTQDPELRFSSLTFRPNVSDPTNLFPQALGRKIGDRVTCKKRPIGRTVINRDVFIRGISHTVIPDEWKTTFGLQSASKFAFFTLDSSTLGVLDTNAISY